MSDAMETKPALVNAVLSRSTSLGSLIHGETHWLGVAAAGVTICDMTPEADPRVVLCFGLFHDAMRKSDGRDPEHGTRAVALARELRDAGALVLDGDQMQVLEHALVRHDKGEISTDPTIGACWDADRLNLGRVHVVPKTSLMSTRAGRRLAVGRNASWFWRLRFDWRAVFLKFNVRTAASTDAVYLRFGGLPEDGISRGPWPATPEEGVSVFQGYEREGWEGASPSYQIDARLLMLGTETRLVRLLLSQARPLYVMDGECVGMGGSGEPLLADARIVREVTPDDDVGVAPDHPKIRECVEWWKRARRGGFPGKFPVHWRDPLPGDRSASPFAVWAIPDFSQRVRGYLWRWGFLEDYEKMLVESRARRESNATTKEVREEA